MDDRDTRSFEERQRDRRIKILEGRIKTFVLDKTGFAGAFFALSVALSLFSSKVLPEKKGNITLYCEVSLRRRAPKRKPK